MIGALAVTAAFVWVLAGCGGSATGSNVSFPDPSQEFSNPGSESNKYAEFGTESSNADREAASRVLTQNFRARAAARWAGQCASLSPAAVKHVEEEDSLLNGAKGCVAALQLAAEPLEASAEARADTLTGPIDVLRVKGIHAFALYHGKGDEDHAMPMEKIGGVWKVAALATIEL